jgi:hypothetical protein
MNGEPQWAVGYGDFPEAVAAAYGSDAGEQARRAMDRRAVLEQLATLVDGDAAAARGFRIDELRRRGVRSLAPWEREELARLVTGRLEEIDARLGEIEGEYGAPPDG